MAAEAASYGRGGVRDRIRTILQQAQWGDVTLPPDSELVAVDRLIAEVLGHPAAMARWGGVH